ncbi:MAG: hypothetical protein OEO79_03465 [Gemmatimonadota bacterium]|nr:hypothetical protein [Gemmatimonadota bacterium]MDH3423009.1 hypothetical protein [Gemmatimonadota bacterium]
MEPHIRRTHFLPRTRDGRIAVMAFVALFALAMPPVTHRVLNRAEPWIAGLPFIFAILLAVYVALIGVLIWTYRRGV